MPISMPYFAATSGTKATTAVLNNHSDHPRIIMTEPYPRHQKKKNGGQSKVAIQVGLPNRVG